MAAADPRPLDVRAERLKATIGYILGMPADIAPPVRRVRLRRRAWRLCGQFRQLDRVVAIVLNARAPADRISDTD